MKKFIGRLIYVLNWPYIRFVLKSERVYVLLVDRALAEIFLVKNLVRWHDTWWLPGGGLVRGESRRQAACREVREEVGLKLDPGKLKEFISLPGSNSFRPVIAKARTAYGLSAQA